MRLVETCYSSCLRNRVRPAENETLSELVLRSRGVNFAVAELLGADTYLPISVALRPFD